MNKIMLGGQSVNKIMLGGQSVRHASGNARYLKLKLRSFTSLSKGSVVLLPLMGLTLAAALPAAAAQTDRVSIATGGAEGNGSSFGALISISAAGRYVEFSSSADNLVKSDRNRTSDV